MTLAVLMLVTFTNYGNVTLQSQYQTKRYQFMGNKLRKIATTCTVSPRIRLDLVGVTNMHVKLREVAADATLIQFIFTFYAQHN